MNDKTKVGQYHYQWDNEIMRYKIFNANGQLIATRRTCDTCSQIVEAYNILLDHGLK